MGDRSETAVEILLVEDNPGDVRLVEEALHGTPSALHVTRDGKEALDFLYRRTESADASFPDIVLLDLNLPKVDGTQVLDEIRNDSAMRAIRVIVITSAREEYADLEPETIGEGDFLTKPTDPDEFMTLVRATVFDE